LGSAFFVDNPADHDSEITARYKRAGLVIFGKTNTPEMGLAPSTEPRRFGPTRNPWNLDYTAGGSSGGSAAAVAAGIVPMAHATDGGGSIRIPASWCGVYGFKASFGRIPFVARPDAFNGTHPFLFEGPLTRTVEDAALALGALAGYDPRSPYGLDEEVDFTAALRGSVRGRRIAYSPNLDVYPVDRRVAEVVERAVRAFEEAGAHVEEVSLGIERDQRELSDLWCRMIMYGSVGAFESFKANGVDLLGEHREDFPEEYLRWVETGYRLTLPEIIHDQWLRSEIFDAIQGVFANYDLLVTPTVADVAVPNSDDGNTVGPSRIEGVDVDPLIGWCMTYFTNFTGHPSASVPAGLTDEGLPVGMQIIGKRYADTDVLTASAVFEQLRPWHHTYAQLQTASA
jgi:amidase/aspartyl-tRNA(Asn)/glutamyl-tRNA(Gln) amidotransferase subunit A